jgi:AraC-like DNA-binding protein
MLENAQKLRDIVRMNDDPFSDILKLTNAQPVVSGGFTAGGAWAIRFPEPDKIKFFAVVKGGCWLLIDGDETAVRVESGDVLLLAAQRTFVLAGDLSASPVDATTLFAGRANKTATLGEGEDCVQIGGHIRLDPVTGGLLADMLPRLIHVRAGLQQATILQWLLEQLVRERTAERPGANLSTGHLAQLMFVQILRLHLETSDALPTGWLRAIADKRLAQALRLMHSDPGRSWHLGELATAAGMSRTSFAHYFKTVAGVPPLTYLTDWRMRLAEHALREGDMPVSSLAQSLGYTSESAFSNAFKRVTGSAPKRYRNQTKSKIGKVFWRDGRVIAA